ncbi:20S-pre-rRNA D-site endonuclease-like protein [Emericellopsis cladophorae]|uniref:20S-pre-rRNA D-site endonuclease NOB1 n=1 Tax=Emericellopsis cladophorae TaxID=2686198 RepID=A0A9P9XY86_9HYPO|nr:20S-pre-rRNA D-site endonuclease-like protein [Emericellopsis cladophorae]KAI6780069.1 20S-pre-rRNA D-site endonuclease-like protein [Emericellopsis cladophorae]
MADQAPTTTAQPAEAAPSTQKPIHSLVVDTGPLIKNDPPADTLRSRAEALYILPSVIPEIRDTATRARVETQLLPFLTLRSPAPKSVNHIIGFARRTGDLEVLSRTDIEVLALAYELELEKNGGDWRLRNLPGQKTLNGKPPSKQDQTEDNKGAQEEGKDTEQTVAEEPKESTEEQSASAPAKVSREEADEAALDNGIAKLDIDAKGSNKDAVTDAETATLEAHNVPHESVEATDLTDKPLVSGEKADEVPLETEEGSEPEDDDDGDWITPTNIKKHKAKDTNTSAKEGQTPVTLQAAILTSDFAMQNVALRMNLNLVSPSLARISRLKTWILRCHGCFKTTRDMERRFCPTCGQPTLTRVACTVDDRTGQVTLHLKKNFQWNNRGNVFSVPKPVHGTANGRAPRTKQNGGGKNRWGNELILAEDQKEFTRATDEQRRTRKKDVMDEDMLPGILTGHRSGGADKIRVGAGRNVNSRKR